MISSVLIDKFWRDGYLVLPNFFSEDEMSVLQQRILQHYGEDPEMEHSEEFLSRAKTEVIPWFPEREGVFGFNRIENSAKMLETSQSILGEGWRSLYCMVMFSKANSKGQAWHQDCPPENSQVFNLNRLVYTMDINDETGGQVVVKPGSHRAGELSVGDPNETFEDQVVLNPSKGTLVMLHGHTWHKVLPVKGHYRISTNYRAIPMDTPEDVTDTCVYRNMRFQFSSNSVLEERR